VVGEDLGSLRSRLLDDGGVLLCRTVRDPVQPPDAHGEGDGDRFQCRDHRDVARTLGDRGALAVQPPPAFAGCTATFVLLYMLFTKLFPIVSIWEMREGRESALHEVVARVRSYLPAAQEAKS